MRTCFALNFSVFRRITEEKNEEQEEGIGWNRCVSRDCLGKEPLNDAHFIWWSILHHWSHWSTAEFFLKLVHGRASKSKCRLRIAENSTVKTLRAKSERAPNGKWLVMHDGWKTRDFESESRCILIFDHHWRDFGQRFIHQNRLSNSVIEAPYAHAIKCFLILLPSFDL